jgi:hypothetical protein
MSQEWQNERFRPLLFKFFYDQKFMSFKQQITTNSNLR